MNKIVFIAVVGLQALSEIERLIRNRLLVSCIQPDIFLLFLQTSLLQCCDTGHFLSCRLETQGISSNSKLCLSPGTYNGDFCISFLAHLMANIPPLWSQAHSLCMYQACGFLHMSAHHFSGNSISHYTSLMSSCCSHPLRNNSMWE